MFTGTALCKCLLITKPAYVITRCFFTSLFKNAFYSQKPHGLESFFLHMFGHFVFLHLRIRNCLLSTKTALARIRFSSHVWLLCVSTLSNSKMPINYKNRINSNPFFFTCSATLCFFNLLFGLASHSPCGPCKNIPKYTKTKGKEDQTWETDFLPLYRSCERGPFVKRLPGTLESLFSMQRMV